MYALETHYLRGLEGCNCSEEVEVLGGPPNHMVGGAKFFPPHPLVMNRVDLTAQKTSHLCQLFKDLHQFCRYFLYGKSMHGS